MSIFSEAMRRHVFRVGAAYLVVAWLLLQISDVLLPALQLPDWTVTFVTMLLAAPIFGWVASTFPRRTFLPWVYLFFISNRLIFWDVFSKARGSGDDFGWLGRIFLVRLSDFNLFVVSVFWSFMADIYTRE